MSSEDREPVKTICPYCGVGCGIKVQPGEWIVGFQLAGEGTSKTEIYREIWRAVLKFR